MASLCLRVYTLYQYSLTSGPTAGLDVFPAIPNHKTFCQINPPITGRLQQQTRPGLAAGAIVNIIVITDPNVINGYLTTQRAIDGLDDISALRTPCYVGLIGHHNQQEASLAQRHTGFGHAG